MNSDGAELKQSTEVTENDPGGFTTEFKCNLVVMKNRNWKPWDLFTKCHLDAICTKILLNAVEVIMESHTLHVIQICA